MTSKRSRQHAASIGARRPKRRLDATVEGTTDPSEPSEAIVRMMRVTIFFESA
jgi:hypothetical protein